MLVMEVNSFNNYNFLIFLIVLFYSVKKNLMSNNIYYILYVLESDNVKMKKIGS